MAAAGIVDREELELDEDDDEDEEEEDEEDEEVGVELALFRRRLKEASDVCWLRA